ncbi:MAG: ATP-binding protein [Aeriscardovia sp.]|nr:ATP-binding protein [Aeriscardovia sp.]
MKNYRARIADGVLKRKLAGKGAVLIEGPKWCGKTTTAEQVAKSVIYLSDPLQLQRYKIDADMSLSGFLEGDTPHLIDEWQLIPKIWDSVRFEVDHRKDLGQFILTGSAVPAKLDDINHTGTGRFSWLRMRPMTLFESGESSGCVSLKDLFETEDAKVSGNANLDLESIAFLMCRGGWPRAVDIEDKQIAIDQSYDYVDAVAESDLTRVDGIKKNADRVRRILKSYARHQGGQASLPVLMDDIKTNENESISDITLGTYLTALQKIFMVEDMPAWNPNLRSKTAIRTADTRYFVDPSIATAALGVGPNDLLQDLNTMGLLFETMAVRDLRVYAEPLDGNVFHFRDKNGLECDTVIHLRNGKYALIEIKLGGENLVNEGAKNLISLANKIDTDRMKSPSFLMVLTANGSFPYRRQDGVYVVPIGCLKD